MLPEEALTLDNILTCKNKKNERIPSQKVPSLTQISFEPLVFKFSLFLEISLYNILFYFILGPFSNPLIMMFRGKNLVYNLNFWGVSWRFFINLICFGVSFSSFALFFFFENTWLNSVDVYMLLSSGLIRIFLISIWFATTKTEQFQKILKTRLTNNEKNNEFFWTIRKIQSGELVEKELERIIENQEIDVTFFRFLFIGEIQEDIKKEFIKGYIFLIKFFIFLKNLFYFFFIYKKI